MTWLDSLLRRIVTVGISFALCGYLALVATVATGTPGAISDQQLSLYRGFDISGGPPPPPPKPSCSGIYYTLPCSQYLIGPPCADFNNDQTKCEENRSNGCRDAVLLPHEFCLSSGDSCPPGSTVNVKSCGKEKLDTWAHCGRPVWEEFENCRYDAANKKCYCPSWVAAGGDVVCPRYDQDPNPDFNCSSWTCKAPQKAMWLLLLATIAASGPDEAEFTRLSGQDFDYALQAVGGLKDTFRVFQVSFHVQEFAHMRFGSTSPDPQLANRLGVKQAQGMLTEEDRKLMRELFRRVPISVEANSEPEREIDCTQYFEDEKYRLDFSWRKGALQGDLSSIAFDGEALRTRGDFGESLTLGSVAPASAGQDPIPDYSFRRFLSQTILRTDWTETLYAASRDARLAVATERRGDREVVVVSAKWDVGLGLGFVLDPECNLFPIEVSDYSGPTKTETAFVREVAEFRGVWFPVRIERERYFLNRDGRYPEFQGQVTRREVFQVDPATIRIGEDIPDEVFRLEFPVGTRVQDQVAASSYVVGTPGVGTLEQGAEEFVQQMKLTAAEPRVVTAPRGAGRLILVSLLVPGVFLLVLWLIWLRRSRVKPPAS